MFNLMRLALMHINSGVAIRARLYVDLFPFQLKDFIMKTIALITTLSLSVLFAASGCAAVQESHTAHHTSAASAEQKAPQTMPMMQDDANDPMDIQMKTMREIHGKMMRATSTDERKKLRAEHSKAMQGGMAMMQNMQDMPMMHDMPMSKDMQAMGGMKCDMNEGMASHMMAKHKMMEKRMKMMETMMQMMMDRMINDDYDEHQTSAKK
jgi:hypothetical protein